MEDLSKERKESVEEFIDVTGESEEVAIQCLQSGDWDVDNALDLFYNDPEKYGGERSPEPEIDKRPYAELYERYKDPNVEMVYADGITLLCEDLKVDPSDVVMMVISWHMHAATMCEFTKDEFFDGLLSLEIDSLEKFKRKLPTLYCELDDEEMFKEIYHFAFSWANEKGQKSLACDTAIELWKLLLVFKDWPLLDHWCKFMEEKYNKPINMDLWSQILEFATTVRPSLKNYDPEGAWPCLIDDFVDYLNENGLVNKEDDREDDDEDDD